MRPVVPNVLRWYWWRLNGTGYAVGTLLGIVASLALLVSVKVAGAAAGPIATGEPIPAILALAETLNLPYVSFPLVSVLSMIGCLVGTWLVRPTDEAILVSFYRTVRPFGAWKPIRERARLTRDELAEPGERAALAVVNLGLSAVVILGAYLSPMYLVGHWHAYALAWFAVAVVAAVILYFTWYRNLPSKNEEIVRDTPAAQAGGSDYR